MEMEGGFRDDPQHRNFCGGEGSESSWGLRITASQFAFGTQNHSPGFRNGFRGPCCIFSVSSPSTAHPFRLCDVNHLKECHFGGLMLAEGFVALEEGEGCEWSGKAASGRARLRSSRLALTQELMMIFSEMDKY
ncbi:hypothetical protein AAMO2058_001089400 [Amorphochlora amoebiformis]